MNHSADADSPPPLAVFDLDGTLLRGDSLLPFLLRFGWRRRRWRALATMGFHLLAHMCRLASARSVKQRLLRDFLGGERLATINESAQRFCDTWLASHLLPAGIERLREHQQTGYRVILLTASPSVYVPIVAKRLGIEEVVCTQVAWQGEVCTGVIVGDNCKGEAKLAMLRDYLPATHAPAESYAYGDSRSDLPVLNWVRHGRLLRAGKFCAVRNGE